MDMFKAGCAWETDPYSLKLRHGSAGEYTVKLGYHLAYCWKMAKKGSRGESSDNTASQKFWKMLWRSRVPERVKIHGWRLYHHALPVCRELQKRGCGELIHCCFCGFKGESDEHLFIHCWWSKVFWSKLGVAEAPSHDQEVISSWWWHYASAENPELFLKVLVGVWLIWQNRNLMVHGSKGWLVDESVFRVNNYLSSLRTI